MFRKLVLVLVLVAFPATMVFGQDIFYFDSKDDFEQFNRDHNKVMKGVLEDFENNNWPDNDVATLMSPLEGNIPNGPFTTGLRNKNLFLTSSAGDLVLLTNGFFGAVTDIVGANTFADTTNLNFTSDEGDKTGIGFDVVDLINGGMADISIYDTDDNLIDTIAWPAPLTPQFFGVWSSTPIGRINIAAQNDGGEQLDNVQMWIPEPASLSLLLLGGLVLIRRR